MAMPIRIQCLGAVYHVMMRRNRGKRVFDDEAGAEVALRRGRRALGVSEEGLKELAKGAAEKVALAWWLRRETTVSLRWVSQRLELGHYTRGEPGGEPGEGEAGATAGQADVQAKFGIERVMSAKCKLYRTDPSRTDPSIITIGAAFDFRGKRYRKTAMSAADNPK